MSELGEIFAAHKEDRRKKKSNNLESTLAILNERKVPYKKLSAVHLWIGSFDFWPSTGLFIHKKTKKRGRGIFNLLKAMK
jgi:uncharacterized membrane protein YsdA (DUF1294 family)